MTKRIWVLIEVQDDDKYVLDSYDSYEKAEEAKEQCENDDGHEYEIEESNLYYDAARPVDFIVDWNDMTILTSFTTPIKINKPYKTLNPTGYPIQIEITEFEDDCIMDYKFLGGKDV